MVILEFIAYCCYIQAIAISLGLDYPARDVNQDSARNLQIEGRSLLACPLRIEFLQAKRNHGQAQHRDPYCLPC